MSNGWMLGIRLTNIRHTLYEISCANGYITRKKVSRTSPSQLPDITRTEWHLVRPGLVVLIVCLAYRLQLLLYQQICVQMKTHEHKKTAALAT